MSKKLMKILIIRLSAIGDAVHGIPAAYSIRKSFPNACISWVVEDKASGVILNNPLLDKVYVMPKQRWKEQGFSINTLKEIFDFFYKIRKEKYDVAIDLQELFKSGLTMFLSGAKRRIAHAKTREFADIFANEKLKAHDIFDNDRKVIDRYLEPARHLGCETSKIKFELPPVSDDDKWLVGEMIANIDKSKPTIVFSVATMWESKHWINEYWANLMDELKGRVNIVFTGVEKDNILISEIISLSNNSKYINLAGKTNLMQLIEVFNNSDMVIAPDTGPLHIANATHKPIIVGLYGSMSNIRTGPVGENNYALSANLDCSPCCNKNCAKDDGYMECMKKLTPDRVIDIIEKELL